MKKTKLQNKLIRKINELDKPNIKGIKYTSCTFTILIQSNLI